MDEKNGRLRKPPWLKVRLGGGPKFTEVAGLLKRLKLHTVCEEAHCPNLGQCFAEGTATFIILGNRCTRNCRFCNIHPGLPSPVDNDEPWRVAEAVRALKLRFAVVTSVTRDDLPDGGAEIFAQTIRRVREKSPDCQVEVLIPDLKGDPDSLDTILKAQPDVLAHNLETSPALYPAIRPQADYKRSLAVLKYAREKTPGIIIKSGIMVGLGETMSDIKLLLENALNAGCHIFTVGQYLPPSNKHAPVKKYYSPDEFMAIKEFGERIGFKHVEAGPLVRSSYRAAHQAAGLRQKDKSDTLK